MSQERLTLLQLVSNDVELQAAIKPGRDRAAEPRPNFDPFAIADDWCTRSILRGRSPVSSEILSEIDRTVIDVQQSFAWSAFCVDYIMRFQLDMKELQFIQCARGVMDGNRRVVNQVPDGHQHIINQQ